MGITLYESQIERLFDGTEARWPTVRAQARKIAVLGGCGGSAERYWSTEPA